jgi:hypothetical protein
MKRLKQILMERDGLSSTEADLLITQARQMVYEGEDPEEILYEEFGLEPDYTWELIEDEKDWEDAL